VDWSKTGLAVLRSTWDAHARPGEFQEWLLRIESLTSVCNNVNLAAMEFRQTLFDRSERSGRFSCPIHFFEPNRRVSCERADVPWEQVVVSPPSGAARMAFVSSIRVPSSMR